MANRIFRSKGEGQDIVFESSSGVEMMRFDDAYGSIVSPSGFAVGSIQQSMLELVDFQTEMGTTDWALCDGSAVPIAAKLYKYMTVLPDATGRFLRSAGGDAEATIGAAQADATAPNGLASVAAGGHTPRITIRTADAGNVVANEVTNIAYIRKGTWGTQGFLDAASIGNHSHSFTGDTETRPINITVNTFIKIN